jgi:hypothetical protein
LYLIALRVSLLLVAAGEQVAEEVLEVGLLGQRSAILANQESNARTRFQRKNTIPTQEHDSNARTRFQRKNTMMLKQEKEEEQEEEEEEEKEMITQRRGQRYARKQTANAEKCATVCSYFRHHFPFLFTFAPTAGVRAAVGVFGLLAPALVGVDARAGLALALDRSEEYADTPPPVERTHRKRTPVSKQDRARVGVDDLKNNKHSHLSQ